MKTMALIGLCGGMSCGCLAEQVLAEYDWETGPIREPGVGVMTEEGKHVTKVTNTNEMPLQVQLLRITNPPVTKTLYAIVGEVKYEGVKGTGYLEMWNYFPPAKAGMPEGAYFSRTLGESGKMGKIVGTSNWREFMLPFDRTGASGPPTRLEFNVRLAGPGTVVVGKVKLVEYSGSLNDIKTGSTSGWWPVEATGYIGGIGGATLGCLGALIGWMAAKGRSRWFVVGASTALIGLGTVLTLAGVAAIAMGQPYMVWFVLLLIGVLLLAIFPFRLRAYQRRYSELELRRMSSMDA